MILEGNALVEIDGHEYELTTFDTTYVDAGVPHGSATPPPRTR